MKQSSVVCITIAAVWIASVPIECATGQHHDDRVTSAASMAQRRASAAITVARAALAIADESPDLPDTRPKRISSEPIPMRIEFVTSAVSEQILPAQLVVKHWANGCPAGDRQERDIRQMLTPCGWQIGNAESDQIRLIHISQNEPCPQLVLFQNGKLIRSWEGYQSPSFLSHELRRAWDSSPTSQANVAIAGPAGVIHGSSQIHGLVEWWRSNIGERTKAVCRWDRSGAQSFPLIAKGDWSALAVFGRFGHMQLSAEGATNLPINSVGFGYRVDGNDIAIDLDPITFQELGVMLDPDSRISSQPIPTQFGPATLLSIVSVIRDLWSLLHPSCDLQLGGNISATAALTDDVLAIDFQQAPSIKLVALFTFQLRVDRIEISESSVRVVFGGSMFVKERTFKVE